MSYFSAKYHEGYDAYCENKTKNPYKQGSVDAIEWDRGWAEAKRISETPIGAKHA